MVEPLINYPWSGRLNKDHLPHEGLPIPENLQTSLGEIRDVLDSMTEFNIKEKSFFLYMLNIAGKKVMDRQHLGLSPKYSPEN